MVGLHRMGTGPIRILVGVETAVGVMVVAGDPQTDRHANDNYSHLEAPPISRRDAET